MSNQSRVEPWHQALEMYLHPSNILLDAPVNLREDLHAVVGKIKTHLYVLVPHLLELGCCVFGPPVSLDEVQLGSRQDRSTFG